MSVVPSAISPNAFQSECISWRPVIYFNLIRSIRRILETVQEPSAPSSEDVSDVNNKSNMNRFKEYQLRLGPLLQVEEALMRKLAPPDEDEPTHLGEWRDSGDGGSKEFFINSGSWKKALDKLTNSKRPSSDSNSSSSSSNMSEDRDDPYYILRTFKDDMISLWTDPEVQKILKERNVRLEDTPGL